MIPSETRERFILEMAGRLDGAEIIEAHFFAPRRVSGVESAVAVLAARMPLADAAPSEADDADRYIVYSASYRHTLKGPERGRWEVSVKAEADAPLVTVDQVVRGVARRAEDTDEVDRMTGEEIRAVLDTNLPADG